VLALGDSSGDAMLMGFRSGFNIRCIVSDRRDHLLVIPKGTTVPVGEPKKKWRKKRSIGCVSKEIRLAVQSCGYYKRRLGKQEERLPRIENGSKTSA
jgi:hypothetical protein